MDGEGWVVTATAPLRVADAGGWTDTWFAGHGTVCCVAVAPGATVEVRTGGRSEDRPPAVDLHLPGFGERYRLLRTQRPGRHPLLEAAIERWVPADGPDLEVTVRSGAPVGAGAGGSAAVVVALVGALLAVDRVPGSPGPVRDVDVDVDAGVDGDVDPGSVAAAAHDVETVLLGWQSGVQDQQAAAHGGALILDIDPYPAVAARRLALAPATWSALEQQLLTVFLGRPHRSSAVHEAVIDDLHRSGQRQARLAPLRRCAQEAAAALEAGDLAGYGSALVRNTEAQAALHEGLVCEDARRVIAAAERAGALGWKVNGAGGDGGSVTVLAGEDPGRVRAALGALPGTDVLDLRPTKEGLVVTCRRGAREPDPAG